jgi:DNA repair exonuclease SbcCD ATPase subunit
LNIIIEDTNRIISNFIDYRFDIKLDSTDNAKSKWKLLFYKTGHCELEIGKEFLSGYQQFIINIAIKISLDKHKFYNSSKLFLIDEAIDCVSGENIGKLEHLFSILKKYYDNVIVISHNQEFIGLVDNQIKIKHEKKVSWITN